MLSPINMQCFLSFYDDLGTPPTWRPHSWKKETEASGLPGPRLRCGVQQSFVFGTFLWGERRVPLWVCWLLSIFWFACFMVTSCPQRKMTCGFFLHTWRLRQEAFFLSLLTQAQGVLCTVFGFANAFAEWHWLGRGADVC